MIIDDVRLPEWIERGAAGGPRFNTQVNTSQGGSDSTIILWSSPLHYFDISYGISDGSQYMEVVEFFYARRGRGYGFRFKDWSDYTLTDENIGTGDGATTTFQITKTYNDTVRPFVRKITRPVASSLIVKVNAVVKVIGSDFTVNSTTGVITFLPGDIPAIGQAVTVSGEFDVPVRFDADEMSVELDLDTIGSIPRINLIEVRE